MPATTTNISQGFVAWSQLTAFWTVTGYALHHDPLPGNDKSMDLQVWRWSIATRSVACAIIVYVLTESVPVAAWVSVTLLLLPILRFTLPESVTTATELTAMLISVIGLYGLIAHFHVALVRTYIHLSLSDAQISAIALVGAALVYVVRGGTYVVRGCLNTVGALPLQKNNDKPVLAPSGAQRGASATPAESVDEMEINRGRLIGILERLVLTLVVAAGSYEALGFLVAAKGLIRSEDLQKREFAEYFLVGSLSSVLVALFAGLAVRYALLALWPELLSLQMKGS